jgi:hypothetical protein
MYVIILVKQVMMTLLIMKKDEFKGKEISHTFIYVTKFFLQNHYLLLIKIKSWII